MTARRGSMKPPAHKAEPPKAKPVKAKAQKAKPEPPELKPRGHKRPGLAKTRGLPILSARHVELWRSTDYRWRELFEKADVVSEGEVRIEPEGRVYYGSTSVLLPVVRVGGFIPDDDVQRIAHAAAHDPHARVRAVRVACLEAQLRARSPLARIRAELAVRIDRRGLRVDVDVEARVLEDGQRGSTTKLPRVI